VHAGYAPASSGRCSTPRRSPSSFRASLRLDATSEQQAVAAMVIWRVATLLATLAAGTIVLVLRRHSATAARRGAETRTTA
jgi:hypothetical protein